MNQYESKALEQWFSNFLHEVPPQKIFGFPSTTIMTNIKMQQQYAQLKKKTSQFYS